MAREIKFRGKRVDNGEFIFGNYVEDEEGSSILYRCELDGSLDRKRVIPESVGQYTGLKDKNGVEIYEGDIATEDCNFKGIYLAKIFWDEENASFSINLLDGDIDSLSEYNKYIEVIGNIHDNPSLLEVQP